jgi:hypothetical protein
MTSIVELRRDTLARHLRKHLAGEIRFDAASAVQHRRQSTRLYCLPKFWQRMGEKVVQ